MKHTIIVKLEIEAASWEDACDAVEHVLDVGTFQDEINERMADEGTDVSEDDAPVVSAICDAESGFARAYRREAYDAALKIVETPVRISEVEALPEPKPDYDEAELVVIANKIRALKDGL